MTINADMPSVAQTLDLVFRWNARRVLVRDAGGSYTGARLEQSTRRIALALQSQGIGPGDVVALLGNNSATFLCCYLAVHRLGAVPCTLHARESAASLAGAMAHVGARILMADRDHIALGLAAGSVAGEAAGGASAPLIDMDSSGQGGVQLASIMPDGAAPLALPALTPASPALILLSSGSTGTPKAVIHSQQSAHAFISRARTLFGDIGPQTRHMLILGTSFAAWTFTALPILCAGGYLSIHPSFDPEAFCRVIEAERINHLATVPTLIRFLTPQITAKYDLTSLKTVLCSGEAPQQTDFDRVLDWAPDTDFRCLYLASETGPATAIMASRHDLSEGGKLGSAGRPLPFTDLRIIDPDGGLDDLIDTGQIGEICLRGPSVADGYHGDRARTAAKFINGWWRSGDLGRLDEDGFLFFEGRADNMINTGGIKVYGEEIEAVLLAHPLVEMAAVVGVADAKWGKRIVAHLVVTSPLDDADLLAFCEQQGLAGFKKPREFFFHDALPLGPTGKINRNALREGASHA